MPVLWVEVPQLKKKCERSRKRSKIGSDSLQGQRHLKKSDDICLTCSLGELIVTNYWGNVDDIIIIYFFPFLLR